VRKVPALIATAGLVLATLTACSPGSAAADCTAPATAGDASDLVSVTGDFGAVPTVDFPFPLKTDTTQRSEIIEGTGPGLVDGQKVQLAFSLYDGTSGAEIQKSAYDEKSAQTFAVGVEMPGGLTDGLLCAQVGSRIAVVTAPGAENTGADTTDSLVIVIDVVKSFLTRADGAAQLPVAGLPAVVLAEDGTPGITVPSKTPPTDLEVAVLQKGDGAQVAKGDNTMIHFTGVIWSDKSVFGSTWAENAPVSLVADETAEDKGISTLGQALIGQTIGSQILVVIPPELAYGSEATGTIPADSTLVFVVDILGVE
jgi:FKBP-type peptidyl-prolyl cis-trans isomerase